MNLVSRLRRQEVRAFRALSLMAGLGILVAGPIYRAAEPSGVDPYWLRLLLSGLALAVFAFSLVSKFARRYLDYLAYIWVTPIGLWTVWLLYSNNFSGNYAIAVIMAVILGGVIRYRKFWLMWVYLGLMVSGVVLVSLAVSEPRMSREVFLIIFGISIGLGVYLGNSYRAVVKDLSRLALFPQLNPEPVVEIGAKGVVTYINPAGLKLFPDLPRLGLKHAFLYQTAPMLEKIKQSRPQTLTRRVNVDGTEFFQKISLVPEYGLIRIYGSDLSEITKWKVELLRVKEKLERQQLALMNVLEDVSEEKQFVEVESKGLLGTIGEGIVLTDDSGKVTYVNPAFEQMLGFSKEDLDHTKEFAEAVEAYDLKEKPLPAVALSDSAAVTAKKGETRVLIKSKQGKKVAVVVSAAPIKLKGEFKGVIRVFHDFSEDLKLQRQKDDFFSIASHELRTPLSVIGGNLDTILRGYGKSKLSKVDLELLQDTLTSADRLTKMVSDFLNVSRLDQGRVRLEIKQLDVCKLTGEVTKELSKLAKDKGLSLRYTCTGGHGKVMADVDKVKEILINLVGNSIKFTQKGGIRVSHKVEGDKLVTQVSDTGMGIAKDRQKLLFQRFQQAMERTLAREAGGTGLGLYISREFARLMKGDLWLVKSAKGKGSTFAFSLPLANHENKKTRNYKKGVND